MQRVIIRYSGRVVSVPAIDFRAEIEKALAADPMASAELVCVACDGHGKRKIRASRRPYIRFVECAGCAGTGVESRLR